jgi:large subunit ribosomal protein L30
MAAPHTLRITLARSPIGCKPEQRKTVEALGLRRLGATVDKPANAAVLGMVRAVAHLLAVEEIQ